MEKWRHGNMEKKRHGHGYMEIETWAWRNGYGDIKRKTEAQAIFLNTLTVCSSCFRKFVVCPFVDQETNRSCPFANGLNGLNSLIGPALL